MTSHSGPPPDLVIERLCGAYRCDCRAPDGSIFRMRGVFEHLTPPERLIFTHGWADATGVVEHSPRVTVVLVAVGSRTRVTVRQTGLADRARFDSHLEGWTAALGHLAACVRPCHGCGLRGPLSSPRPTGRDRSRICSTGAASSGSSISCSRRGRTISARAAPAASITRTSRGAMSRTPISPSPRSRVRAPGRSSTPAPPMPAGTTTWSSRFRSSIGCRRAATRPAARCRGCGSATNTPRRSRDAGDRGAGLRTGPRAPGTECACRGRPRVPADGPLV